MMQIRSNWRNVLRAAVFVFLGVTGAASAADIEQGQRIYQRWCVECHGSIAAKTARDSAPPLAQIVRDKTLTPGALRTWLANPHPPMPNLSLGRREIEDIIAYLQSLRTK